MLYEGFIFTTISMTNTQIEDYIKEQRSAGVPDAQILAALTQAVGGEHRG